jgi:CheY-like chemotaxis protein
MTSLISQFETHESVEEAITAAYLGSRYSRGKGKPPVLCVYDSIDMCTFLREMLSSAGYNALTAGSVSDARVLLKATRAKLVVLSARLQTCHGQSTRRLLEEIDPAVTIHVLDNDFDSQDPGEAAGKLIEAIGRHCQKNVEAAEA